MHLKQLSFAFLVSLICAFSVSVAAQKKFEDKNVDYEFILPENDWKLTVKPSEYSPNVEYVYRDKREGHLQVRRVKVDKDDLFSDVIEKEEQKLQFVPGYVAGKQERIAGAFSGRIFNFEFIRSGRNMSGRFYYARVDETTVYVLRFTGLKGKLRAIKNQTDSIFRTFKINKEEEEES